MGFENLLKYIEAITMLLPLIDRIVTMVEGLFVKLGGARGVAKKKAVTEIIKTAMTNAGLDLPDPLLSGVIDSVVKVKNLRGGGFKK